MGAHILAGAAAFGLLAAPIAAVRIGQWRDAQAERAAALAAMLARIESPRLDADEAQAAFAAIRAEAVRLMEASGTRLDIRLDRWDTPHYHTEPVVSERTTVLHLVDTQPHSAVVTATRPQRPMLPAVPVVTRGELQRARFYDIGRAG